ncbi:MAG: hypothetical protein H0U15_05665 [Geodermatophilaceae bacterium]|nr:hypothetical protein [Geodermatophilaceae bacterium]
MSRWLQRGVTRRAVLGAALTLVVLGAAGWYFFGQSEPTPWNKPATVDGAIVRLTYTGSECQDSAEVEVDEDSSRVVITVKETVRARSCNDVGVPYDVEVRLDAPLSDRELVDGACQIPEYEGDVECGPSKVTVEPSES